VFCCHKVWIDGVEIAGLVPEGHPFKFIELLARNSVRVSSDDITKVLSPARQDGNTPARQAKTAAKKAISDAMTKAGRAANEDHFPSAGNGFYRFVLPPYVR
jgi:hypothetical protein